MARRNCEVWDGRVAGLGKAGEYIWPDVFARVCFRDANFYC